MQDVAERAGVSRMTVSYALRGNSRIPLETRNRVLEAARDIGYRPNPLVSALMAQMGGQRGRKQGEGVTIALVHNAAGPDDSPSASYMPGVRERAQDLGYGLDDVFLRAPGMTWGRMSAILRSRGIRGPIMMRMGWGHVSLDWEHFSAVTHGYTLIRPDLTRVVSAFFDGIMLALRNAKKLGYKRPGLVLNKRTNRGTRYLWQAGYTLFQAGQPQRDRIPPLLTPTPTTQAPADFAKWLARHRPDVILHAGYELQSALEAAGLRVPDDIGLIHLDQEKARTKLPCAGIDQGWHRVGMALIDSLVAQLHRNEYGLPETPKTILVPGKWVGGETIKVR